MGRLSASRCDGVSNRRFRDLNKCGPFLLGLEAGDGKSNSSASLSSRKTQLVPHVHRFKPNPVDPPCSGRRATSNLSLTANISLWSKSKSC